jgi:predicted membrane-bound spermidine synthase
MWWYFSFFLISGFCSLVYEVVWLRLSMAEFGVTTAMISIVLSMFMAGLGLGSWGAGWMVRRLRSRIAVSALRLYALAELLIGISALLIPHLLKWGHLLLLNLSHTVSWQSSSYYLVAGAWVAFTLLPWCTCMGATFPLLMAVIRQTAGEESEHSFSYLYVANVLGALLGTTASAFFLIELLGFRRTLFVTSTFNACLAAAALSLSFVHLSSRTEVAPTENNRTLWNLPKNFALWILFATGLVSMGMEVVWIREFTPYLGNVVYAFASVLGVYLLATFWGSRDYRSWIRSHQIMESRGAWILIGLLALLPLAAADPRLPIPIGFLPLGIVRLCAIVPFCCLLGFLTPMFVDFWSSGDPDRAGRAYAVNVLGSILGPLIAGFLLLPLLGERWALVVLSLPLFALGAVAALQRSIQAVNRSGLHINPKMQYGGVVVIAILLAIISQDYDGRFTRRELRRDYTATVIATGEGFQRQLLVNGTGMTVLTPITKVMAHLPLALMHRSPRNGLVICFGMGTSFRSMVSWGIPTTAVDLVPSVPALFGYFHSDAQRVLESPNAHVVVDDGRRFLDGSSDLYDVIVVDPPPPTAATGSSLLYSREFYAIVRKHLAAGGILQIWYPTSSDGDSATTASVAKALMESFPYVRAFRSLNVNADGIHFLASMEPIPSDSGATLAARLSPVAAADLVEWGPATTAQDQFDRVLSGELPIAQLIAPDPRVPPLEDDQPINEYYLLRTWFHYYR